MLLRELAGGIEGCEVHGLEDVLVQTPGLGTACRQLIIDRVKVSINVRVRVSVSVKVRVRALTLLVRRLVRG